MASTVSAYCSLDASKVWLAPGRPASSIAIGHLQCYVHDLHAGGLLIMQALLVCRLLGQC